MRFFKRLKRYPLLAIMIALFLTVSATVTFVEQDKRRIDRKAIPDGREVRPRKKATIPEIPARSLQKAERSGRQVAVIIDDIGFDIRLVEELASIRAPIAFAVLPHAPHATEAARLLHGAGKEILLHLPMEPRSYPAENPGAGALFTNMDAEEIRSRIRENLIAVPHASGVNNHMGSLFMENKAALSIVMEELAKRGLFFIDSRTTPHSLGREAAAKAGVRFAERTLFIDHDRGYTAALANLTQPRRLGWQKGKPLLLIGHPHDETIQAIKEVQTRWHDEEVRVISISAFVSMPGEEEKKNTLAKYR